MRARTDLDLPPRIRDLGGLTLADVVPAWRESGAGDGNRTQVSRPDDFGLAPLAESVRRDLLEILDDRYDRRSTLITSQIPVEQWHAYLQDPTIADAILDRLIHNSYRLTLKGESMRKQKTTAAAKTARRR